MWQNLVAPVVSIIDKIIPDPDAAADAKLKVLQLAQTGELAYLNADVQLAMGQVSINAEEAKSLNPFVSGWRPAAGWVCVSGLAYSFLLQPLLAWWSAIMLWATPPVIGIDTLIGLLLGLLGMGGYRMFEKVKGVAS